MAITKYKEIPFTTADKSQPGDWVLVFGRNKKAPESLPKLRGTGASGFTVIRGPVEETKQEGNARIKTLRGSIAANTRIKIVKQAGN